MKKKLAMALLITGMTVALNCSVFAESAEKHLDLGLTWFATTLDPADESVDYNSWMLMRMDVGECLFTLDENMELVPQLADSWELLDDVTWKIHIREGVTFQNGNPLTAESVMGSIDRVISDNARGQSLTDIKEMTADGQDLTIVTNEPNGSLLAGLSEPLFMIVDPSGDVDSYIHTPICTGPYMVAEFQADNKVELVKYDGYWGGDPGFDSVTVKYVADADSGIMALQNGELDIATVDSGNLSLFETEDYQIIDVQGLREYFAIMNMENEVLQDKNVREALSYALDRDAMAGLLGSDVSVSAAPFPSSVPFGYDNLNKQSYDPDKVKELLAAAGYTDADGDGMVEDEAGNPLKFTISVAYDLAGSGDMIDMMATTMQAQFQAAGIQCDIAKLEDGAAIKNDHDYDIAICNFLTAGTGDPQNYLVNNWMTGGGTNYSGYTNEELDNILKQLSSATDPQERYDYAEEAQEIILDDCAGLFMLTKNYHIVAGADIQNLKAFPLDYYMLTPDVTAEP